MNEIDVYRNDAWSIEQCKTWSSKSSPTLPSPKDLALEQESEEKKAAKAEAAMTPDANTNMDFHRFDEQVNLLLEFKSETPGGDTFSKDFNPNLKRRFIRCSSLATVTQV